MLKECETEVPEAETTQGQCGWTQREASRQSSQGPRDVETHSLEKRTLFRLQETRMEEERGEKRKKEKEEGGVREKKRGEGRGGGEGGTKETAGQVLPPGLLLAIGIKHSFP